VKRESASPLRKRKRFLTRAEECDRILAEYDGHVFEVMSVMLDRQFRTLQDRGGVLLAISGILVSGLGILGRIGINIPRVTVETLFVGGVLALCAATLVVGEVMKIRWLTQIAGETRREWLYGMLCWRDRKTRAFRVATVLLLLAMTLYVASVGMVISNLVAEERAHPHASSPPRLGNHFDQLG
jgi:hypothetical protein